MIRKKIMCGVLVGILIFSSVYLVGCIDLEELPQPTIEIRMGDD